MKVSLEPISIVYIGKRQYLTFVHEQASEQLIYGSNSR